RQSQSATREVHMAASVRRAIEQKIADADYYDAQQMVKTVHRRLCSRGQHDAAADFCVDSACKLAAAKEYDLAANLGADLVDAFASAKAAPSDENLARIETLIAGIPSEAAVVPKYRVLNSALK
ncbi:unnamed protein product, partial [Polarella glacialis]